MRHISIKIEETCRRLCRLMKGQSFTYHNSGKQRIAAVMAKAMELSEQGLIELKQRKTENGTFDYIATGLLTENRMRKSRQGKWHD